MVALHRLGKAAPIVGVRQLRIQEDSLLVVGDGAGMVGLAGVGNSALPIGGRQLWIQTDSLIELGNGTGMVAASRVRFALLQMSERGLRLGRRVLIGLFLRNRILSPVLRIDRSLSLGRLFRVLASLLSVQLGGLVILPPLVGI